MGKAITINGVEKCRLGSGLISSGQKQRPEVDDSKSRESQQDKQDSWDNKAEKAAGWIYLMVETSQTVHFKGKEDDPVAM